MGIQRAFSIALSLAAVALSAVLAWKSIPASVASPLTPLIQAPPPLPSRPLTPAPSPMKGEGGIADAGTLTAVPDLLPPADLASPPLAAGAPRHVRFGVVLVTYEGAEGAPDKGARRKPDAVALATRLADEAKTDFHATVQHGDSGSTDDVGQVTRGVLEPATEGVLFALPVGGVSGVIDTPRGFWIVKRLE